MPLRPSRLTKFSLRSLVYHETVPGHHFQLALFNEDQSQPRFMLRPLLIMIGQLKFIELRERARAALADDFSIREFHNMVLSLGVVPLAVLEREVDKYINGN